MSVKPYIKLLSDCFAEYDKAVKQYGWWKPNSQSEWLRIFCQNLKLKNTVSLISLFGPKNILKYGFIYNDINIFFSGEELQSGSALRKKIYSSALENKKIKLILSQNTPLVSKEIRFPLWLLYMFEPVVDFNRVKKKCDELRWPKISCNGFASMVASWCPDGLRTTLYNQLSEISFVASAGKLMNNTDVLRSVYYDDKIKFISNYMFNICPENINIDSYVTEKIFECIASGSIPIYRGSLNCPEIGIINNDAVIFSEHNGLSNESMKTIEDLLEDKKKFYEYAKQPRLMEGAEILIYEYLEGLRDKLLELDKIIKE